MTDWQHQIRIELPLPLAELARADLANPSLQPLATVLRRHAAIPVSQFDAFSAYLAQAERTGAQDDPLYRWTRATLDDPAARARHLPSFALRIHGAELYPKDQADALEADLAPLVGQGIVSRLSRHDTNPANNMPVPAKYR